MPSAESTVSPHESRGCNAGQASHELCLPELKCALAAVCREGGRGRLLLCMGASSVISHVARDLGFHPVDEEAALTTGNDEEPRCDAGVIAVGECLDEDRARLAALTDRLKPGAWVLLTASDECASSDLQALAQGVGIQVEGMWRKVLSGRLQVPDLVFPGLPSRRGTLYLRAKPAVDRILGAVLLTLSVPLQLVIAVVVRLTSPGPALFRQTRVGQDGRLFTFVKFRTMWVDALDRFPELYDYRFSAAQISTIRFKSEDDPRRTPLGQWLRRLSFDELPNLINVARGDISLIGPRPDIPEMVVHYRPDQLAKLSVKPGITGLAQTRGRGNLTFQETLSLDLEYVIACSLWTDLRIAKETLQCLLARTGAV